MGSLIIVLIAFAVYCNEVYCDTLPINVTKPEDTVLLVRNNSHAIEKGIFWKNLGLSKHKPTKIEESRGLGSASSETNKRKSRFLNSLAFLTGLSFGGLATAASSTMKNIAKLPHASFSINLGSPKTSPYFAAYYSHYPYPSLLPYPFFYPGSFGISPMVDNPTKPQTTSTQNADLITPQVINLFDNKPIDLAENNEDYTDAEKSDASNGADDRTRLRTEADRNAEEKDMIRGCKGGQRKHNVLRGTAREREYLQLNTNDLRATLDFRVANQTVIDNATTTTSPPNNTQTPNMTHHHYYYHHHHHKEHPHYSGYYGGYPQNIHHIELTTDSYSQISYNIPYEQPTNFHHDDKYNIYPGFNPPLSVPFSPAQTNEYTDFNRLYPSGYQLPNISDGFRPV
ncbi:hypothetical protein P5V15_003797 [Pogonomyrmex californicus]